ncbi:MAG: tryptophan-rich sensory protein [Clostridia bacterium]
MNRVKQLLGLVVGLFCTLIVAGLCSYCFNMDFTWYSQLDKPSFMPSGGYFTVFVSLTYLSTIWVIARLVASKKIAPTIVFFVVIGVCSILFVYLFFSLKQIYGSMVFITFTFISSLMLFLKFIARDFVSAIIYFPSLLFNAFCFVIMFALAMAN